MKFINIVVKSSVNVSFVVIPQGTNHEVVGSIPEIGMEFVLFPAASMVWAISVEFCI